MRKIVLIISAALSLGTVMSAQNTEVTVVVDDKTVVKDTVIIEGKRAHLDFDIPFYHKIKKDGDRAVIGNIGLGILSTNAPAPLEFNPHNSLEYFIYSLDSRAKGPNTLSYGIGVTFKNFVMTGDSASPWALCST